MQILRNLTVERWLHAEDGSAFLDMTVQLSWWPEVTGPAALGLKARMELAAIVEESEDRKAGQINATKRAPSDSLQPRSDYGQLSQHLEAGGYVGTVVGQMMALTI